MDRATKGATVKKKEEMLSTLMGGSTTPTARAVAQACHVYALYYLSLYYYLQISHLNLVCLGF
jgi:hypothetical protein